MQESQIPENISTPQPSQQNQSSGVPQGNSDNTAMRVLCYFSILVLIPYLAVKDSDFIRFHAKQGVVLLIAQVITSVLAVIPVLGWVIAPILSLVWFILAIMGIINAVGGKKIELPLIGRFAKNF